MKLTGIWTGRRFWRVTVLQLLVVTSLIAVLAIVLKSPLTRAANELKRVRAGAHSEQLFESVSEGRVQNTRVLLKKGANPDYTLNTPIPGSNPPRFSQESVLNLSIRRGDITNMKLLLDAGANPRAMLPVEPVETVILSRFDVDKKLALLEELLAHIPERPRRHMDVAIDSKQPKLVEFLQKLGYSYGPRELALIGDLENLKAAEALAPGLIQSPVEEYQGCRSLLGIALLRGHQTLADWLLGSGSSLDIQGAYGASVMHLAAVGRCDWIIAKLRTAGCDPDAADDSARAPLHYAIQSPFDLSRAGNPGTVEALIEAGADVSYERPGNGSIVDAAITRYVHEGQTPDSKSILLLLLSAGGKPQHSYDMLPWISQNDREIGQAIQKLRLLNSQVPQASPR